MFAHWIRVQHKLNRKIDKSLDSDTDLSVWIIIQYLIEFQAFHAVGPNFVYLLAHLISEQFLTARGLCWAKLCLEVQNLTLANHMDQSTDWHSGQAEAVLVGLTLCLWNFDN